MNPLYLNVLSDSSLCMSAGLTVAIMAVLELPPRLSLSNLHVYKECKPHESIYNKLIGIQCTSGTNLHSKTVKTPLTNPLLYWCFFKQNFSNGNIFAQNDTYEYILV